MSVYQDSISLSSRGMCDIIDISRQVQKIVSISQITKGIVSVSVPGSTGGITTIEYEPGVVSDLKKTIERLVSRDQHYDHDATWGDGNGFSHVRAAILGASLCLSIQNGKIVRGTWQQIVFIDFDNRSRTRNIMVTIVGE